MNAEKLRAAVLRKPFRPLRLVLHAGQPLDILHPETIWITDAWVGVAQDPMPPIIFEPEMVVSVRYLRNGRARK